MLFLMHPRIPLAVLATRTHWPMDIFLSTRTSGSFSKELPSSRSPPVCPGPWGYSSPGAGPCTCLCWIADSSSLLISPPVEVPQKGCPAFWDISQSSWLCVTRELTEAASAPPSKSLINKLNTGSNFEPWETPLVTGFQLHPVPLTAAFWFSSQSSSLCTHST